MRVVWLAGLVTGAVCVASGAGGQSNPTFKAFQGCLSKGKGGGQLELMGGVHIESQDHILVGCTGPAAEDLFQALEPSVPTKTSDHGAARRAGNVECTRSSGEPQSHLCIITIPATRELVDSMR
jgi:hypothetical protein